MIEEMPDEHQKPIGELIVLLSKTFRDGIKKIRAKDREIARASAAAGVMCAAVHDAREPYKISSFLAGILGDTTPALAADRHPEAWERFHAWERLVVSEKAKNQPRDDEVKRIQQCCNELTEIGKKYHVLDFIEALQCSLGSYAHVNFGVAGVEIIANSLIKKSKEIDGRLNAQGNIPR